MSKNALKTDWVLINNIPFYLVPLWLIETELAKLEVSDE